MQVIEYDIERYCQAERDLCELHSVSEEDNQIDIELAQLQKGFEKAYPQMKRDCDHEFPSWHHNLRLFWVYLYSDSFYSKAFILCIQELLSSMDRSWFAEFECYSPALKSSELPTGSVGEFLVFKDTVIFCESEQWETIRPKLGM